MSIGETEHTTQNRVVDFLETGIFLIISILVI